MDRLCEYKYLCSTLLSFPRRVIDVEVSLTATSVEKFCLINQLPLSSEHSESTLNKDVAVLGEPAKTCR